MKKIMLLTGAIALFMSASHAQNKRKPGFSFNAATITELGMTPEQKQKLESIGQASGLEVRKLNLETFVLDSINLKKQDSVLTAVQKQNTDVMREAVKAENKANPALRKIFTFDPKATEALALTTEQQTKLKAIAQVYEHERWNSAQRWQKFGTRVAQEQENVLTDVQKQKVADMKLAIIEYNKTVL